MPPAPIEPTSPESSSSSSPSHSEPPPATVSENRRFANLRGVQWRIDLGVLPFSDTSSIDDLRRATADSRRRYATLRRRLLVDPHIPKDGSNSPDLVMDNPLSQNPDSMWGRFFRSAELERMVDQDLSRLYPEHGSYFQTPACQGMLRRILLLWCLRHPEYGYRQGMHELMAPLLYVLHVDIENLSEVRKLYEDHFIDKFDGFSFNESDLTYRFDFKKLPESVTDEIGPRKTPTKASTLDELDPNIQSIVMLSDAYGAEGELGIVISDKFMEHDAYCLFDALMNGSGSGAVAMAEFFSPSPLSGSHTGLPPVLEASSALYHLLSIVDSSLHSHLVELGVEPQYFALRWLRVLFGREFALEDLLMIWDEIFACDNKKRNDDVIDDVIIVLNSLRGGFISALAVSMILYLRSSLLATENATSCLQRLLNFPEDINIEKLIAKAKSLQDLAMDANNSAPLPMNTVKPRGHSLSADSPSGSPAGFVPESYWEEKWRVMQKEAEEKKQGNNSEKRMKNRIQGWSEKVRLRLARTESAPTTPSKGNIVKRDGKKVRRNLLEDLARQLGSDEDDTNELLKGDVNGCSDDNDNDNDNSPIFSDPPSPNEEATTNNNNHENESERSSVASNLSVDENEIVEENNEESCRSISSHAGEGTVPLKTEQSDDFRGKVVANFRERKLLSGKFQWLWKFGKNIAGGGGGEGSVVEKGGTSDGTKASLINGYGDDNNNNNDKCNGVSTSINGYDDDNNNKNDKCDGVSSSDGRKASSINGYDDDNNDKCNGVSSSDGRKASSINGYDDDNNDKCNGVSSSSSMVDGSNDSLIIKGDDVDQNVMVTLRNLGHSMLENIQVIESVFQQDRCGQIQTAAPQDNSSKSDLVGRGQVTAMAALKELRKISNLLSEM